MDIPRLGLHEILALMREHKALRVKMGNLEVELDPSAFKSERFERPQAPEVSPDEDYLATLFYSTPYGPVPQEEKLPPAPPGEELGHE